MEMERERERERDLNGKFQRVSSRVFLFEARYVKCSWAIHRQADGRKQGVRTFLESLVSS